jgi:rhodanese-related sulfurtransferase
MNPITRRNFIHTLALTTAGTIASACVASAKALPTATPEPQPTETPEPQPTPRPVTFKDIVNEAMAEVPIIKPADAYKLIQENPDVLVIDVRDAADIAATWTVPGAINVSLGALTYRADTQVPEQLRDPRLQDRSRPIITTCTSGPVGALGGKLLKDMGFTNVQILEGGVRAWKDAGLPIEQTPQG